MSKCHIHLHSNETALLRVTNHILMRADKGEHSALVLLDLTAAFDTTDHSIVVDRLNKWVGISGSALNWFSSYLSNRKCQVVIDNFMSSTAPILCAVPQGSTLGPILFSLHMLALGNLISQFNCISHHCYADDLQLYFSFKHNDMASISNLHDCMTAIKDWMSLNFLQLNPDKTKVLFFGPNNLIPPLGPSIGPLATNLKPSSRNLGVIFDHNLHFDSHINKPAFSNSGTSQKSKRC